MFLPTLTAATLRIKAFSLFFRFDNVRWIKARSPSGREREISGLFNISRLSLFLSLRRTERWLALRRGNPPDKGVLPVGALRELYFRV